MDIQPKTQPKTRHKTQPIIRKWIGIEIDADDCTCTMRDGKMHVNARVSIEEFNGIIDGNLMQVIEYLKAKNIDISVL